MKKFIRDYRLTIFVSIFLFFGVGIVFAHAETCASWTYSDWSVCSSEGQQSRSVISSLPEGCDGGEPVLSQSCTPAPLTCSSWTYSDWTTCSSGGQQTRTLLSSLPDGCTGGSPVLSQSCTPPVIICSSWTYSDWATCSSGGQQTRTVLSSLPSECTGGSPILSQSCTPTPATCTSWTYSSWGTCLSGGQQTRTLISSSPSGCSGGSPVLSQSCTPEPAVCSSWTYSDWATCSSGGLQTRTVLSSLPSGCIGGSPVISQSCTPASVTCTSWTYSSWGTCSSGGQQTRTLISSSPSGCSGGSPILSQSCTPATVTCTSWTYSSWGTCSSGGQQTRTLISSSPSNCAGGSPVLSQSCDSGNVSPIISSIYPKAITPGDVVTINGDNFGDTQGSSQLIIGGYSSYGTIQSWTNTKIEYRTSVYWDAYSEKISIKKCKSYSSCLSTVNGPYFYIQPKIISTNYSTGVPGDTIKISGSYLKNSNIATDGYYHVNVFFNGTKALYPKDGLWTTSELEVVIPEGATDGYITLEMTADGVSDKVSATGPRFDILEAISNDTYSSYQDYFKQINLPAAWGFSKNRREIVVAVIDDGVYNNHPDLKNKMWTNSKEILGNGVDDDKNGYIDDVYGWDYVNNSKDVTPLGTHGTMVAGIIGAEANNGIGIAGVNWNVKIMPLIVCNNTGCSNDSIARAIRYAVDNGAEVINLSLGSNGVSGYTTQYDEAIKYAYDHNVLIVAAAGNGDIVGGIGYDLGLIPQSPVCNDGGSNMVIGVGAVTKDNYQTRWTNNGKCVDIWAPGENIISTAVPMFSSLGGFYDIESGTSFSAPIVTGVVSLLKAVYPALTSQAAINLLISNSNTGIVDAYKTLSANYTAPSERTTVISGAANNSQAVNTSEQSQTDNNVVSTESSLVTKVDNALSKKLSGYILLQVENNGEAWYINPANQNKYYLQNGPVAYQALRVFGLGITNSDLEKIPVGVESRFSDVDSDGDGLADKLEEGLKTDPNKADSDGDGVSDGIEVLKNGTNPLGIGKLSYNSTLTNKLKGKILLQVGSRGEAWYINPKDGKRYYMKDGDAAYQIMRFLSLGVTNVNLRKIGVGILSN